MFKRTICTRRSRSIQGWIDGLVALEDVSAASTKNVLRDCSALGESKQDQFAVRALFAEGLHLRLAACRSLAGRLAPFVLAPGRALGRVLYILEAAVLTANGRAYLVGDVAQTSGIGLIRASRDEDVERAAVLRLVLEDLGRVAVDVGIGCVTAFLGEGNGEEGEAEGKSERW